MPEKKLQPLFWMFVAVLWSSSACTSTPSSTLAEARAAALTNQVDDDMDGNVDENDEGLDEDEDGKVDESNEHQDLCKHRHEKVATAKTATSTETQNASSAAETSDADVSSDEHHSGDMQASFSPMMDGHHDHEQAAGDTDDDSDDDGDGDVEESADDANHADIAAIDCSDVESETAADATPSDTTTDSSMTASPDSSTVTSGV